MISLLQLYPDHLDLNGDAGNLVVLEKRSQWGGLSCSRSQLRPGNRPVSRPDVLLIGHGSTAAWRQVYAEFTRLVPTIEEWMKEGTQVIAVSSGFAALHGLLEGLPISVEREQRQSHFVSEEFEGHHVFGYRNTDLKLANISRHGSLIGTMLHGPLLAKNSWLADEIIEKVRHGENRKSLEVEMLDEVEKLASAASSLAEEQTNS